LSAGTILQLTLKDSVPFAPSELLFRPVKLQVVDTGFPSVSKAALPYAWSRPERHARR
jgi:hypothetical protein